jgi:hypothetical protein
VQLTEAAEIIRAAERARWLAASLTDPEDVATLNRYANEIDRRVQALQAKSFEGPKLIWPQPAFAEATLPMLSVTLKRVFEVNEANSFEHLIQALDCR